MPLLNENVAQGIPKKSKFRQGRSNTDSPTVLEGKTLIPWTNDPGVTWLYFDCTVEVMLDSGIAVHNRLPQVNNAPDTLASCNLANTNLDELISGVNLKSIDQYQDIVQRMGHSRYWFRLYGQALRAGFQIPIPSLKTIGGVPAIPYDKNPQRAFNRILPGGNYGGIIIWHAGWSLWYTTAIPPKSNNIPAVDPAVHIDSSVTPPQNGIQAPFSLPDDNRVSSQPPTLGTPILRTPR